MKLSVLDQAPITKGNQPFQALHYAEELAILADRLGYERMWMAEHHNTGRFASSAPEITAAHLAAKTKQIRIGTGGVMMMHYSPLKMAEVFNTLSALHPGRIDFGVGRAPGGDSYSIYALSEGEQPNVYHLFDKYKTTLDLISGKEPEDYLYKRTTAMPDNITLPEAWMLGSSGQSAIHTGELGSGYAFAQFFNGDLSKKMIDLYREHFQPSLFMEKPNTIVCYMVTVCETNEEAEYEAKPQDIARMLLQQGKDPITMTPEEAKDYPLTEFEKMDIERNRNRGLHLVGSPDEVADRLLAEQHHYGFDEAMICSIPHSQEKRLAVYELLANKLWK